MKNIIKNFGIIALVAVIGLGFVACSRKADAQEGGSGGGRSSRNEPVEAPAEHFKYRGTDDGLGVIITEYAGPGGAVIIPATIEGLPVVRLGRNAFNGSYNLNTDRYGRGHGVTSVVIPASVKEITVDCFWENSTLTSVTIMGSDVLLGGRAFAHCTALKTVNFMGSNITIGGGHERVSNMAAFNSGLVFQGCTNLEEVNFPDVPNALIPYTVSTGIHAGATMRDSFPANSRIPLAVRAKLREFGFEIN